MTGSSACAVISFHSCCQAAAAWSAVICFQPIRVKSEEMLGAR